ncbi:MAG: hypothetical protein ACP5MC_00460 [Candidatus Micrarchaeia archaeon]
MTYQDEKRLKRPDEELVAGDLVVVKIENGSYDFVETAINGRKMQVLQAVPGYALARIMSQKNDELEVQIIGNTFDYGSLSSMNPFLALSGVWLRPLGTIGIIEMVPNLNGREKSVKREELSNDPYADLTGKHTMAKIAYSRSIKDYAKFYKDKIDEGNLVIDSNKDIALIVKTQIKRGELRKLLRSEGAEVYAEMLTGRHAGEIAIFDGNENGTPKKIIGNKIAIQY